MSRGEEYAKARSRGQMYGVAVWIAIAAGAALLGVAGAPDAIVATFAMLAVLGFILFGVRLTRRR